MDRATLLDMLSYRRPAFSRAEREFVNRFIRPTGAEPDAFGNFILRIGTAPILWSAHTDTVHQYGGRQLLHVAGDQVSAVRSECLGADDTTGCWLLLAMIEAGVEGMYIFHRAEEVGCQGSSHIATHTPELLDGITCAIAFDRRGTDSIVTHQMGMRTASDNFALSLAGELDIDTLWPDSGGIYTDTVEYAHLIPECTNVSVGYDNPHRPDESQNLSFAERLRDALLRLDTARLEVTRKPGHDTRYSWLEDDADDYAWLDEGVRYHCDYCGGWELDTFDLNGGHVCGDCLWDLAGEG